VTCKVDLAGRKADVPEGGAIHSNSLCTYPGGCTYPKDEDMKFVMVTSISRSVREAACILRVPSLVKSDIL